MEQGLKQYFGKCPVLCRGAVAHWPASTRWRDLDSLQARVGEAAVSLEVGKSYVDRDFVRTEAEIGLFLGYLKQAEALGRGTAPDDIVYLAQHGNLLDACPTLRDDIIVPPVVGAYGRGDQFQTVCWWGPAA
eukprot:FR737129.1.p1 GENE.FR737129.1~~FR737129.1.p1  ORF type:complete len:144 (+),score=10.84 FR737129.1:38-433(+)